MKTRSIISLLLWAVGTAVGLTACDKDEDTYSFIGDSIVTRWDLQASFPTLITRNLGKSGSGVAYLEASHGKLKGEIATVICGTNDYRSITSDEAAADYATRYVAALDGLGAKRLYVFPVLPRAFKSDDAMTLPTIEKLNKAIESELTAAGNPSIIYLNVYSKFLNDKGSLNMNLSYDGLHLNPQGYEILSSELKKHIL